MFAEVWRGLRPQRGRAVVVMCGMAFGVSAAIVMLSFFAGLFAANEARILSGDPHIVVTQRQVGGAPADLLIDENDEVVELKRSFLGEGEGRMRNAVSTMRMIERDLRNEVSAVSPFLETHSLAVYGVNEVPLVVRGVLPAREVELSQLGRHLEEGVIGRFANYRNGILLGYRAAARLDVHANDRIRLVALDGTLIPVQIAGVYRFDIPARDEGCLVNLRLASSVAGTLPGEANGIAVKTADPERCDEVARMLERLTGLGTVTWEEAHADSLSVFSFVRFLALAIPLLLIALTALALGRLLTVAWIKPVMPVDLDSARDVGTTRSSLMRGLVLSMLPASVGVVAGVVAILVVSPAPLLLWLLPNPFDISAVPMSLHPWCILGSFALACIGTGLASAQYARTFGLPRSSPRMQLDPADA